MRERGGDYILLQHKYQCPHLLTETVEVEESGETRGVPSTANLAKEGGREGEEGGREGGRKGGRGGREGGREGEGWKETS